MSQLLDVYAALAAQVVTVDGVDVPADDLHQVRNAYERPDLPRRLLLPPGANEGSGVVEFTPLTFSQIQVTWRITDLLLWQAQGQGQGIAEVLPNLTAYIAAYAEMLRSLKRPTSRTAVTGFSPAADVYEWPAGSNQWYWGVRCVV
ncbi:MAG: hypothetical protein KC418_18075, partial [Anaerolineales bacterium]|nr:hypothetical protein [Anaerolineales bacterium]